MGVAELRHYPLDDKDGKDQLLYLPGLFPTLEYASKQKMVKGEDLILLEPSFSGAGTALFLVCDGHQGSDTAEFVLKEFPLILKEKLPDKYPNFNDVKAEVEVFAEKIRKAMAQSFVEVDTKWAEGGIVTAGTTVTAALLTGWLLTVCNTGDSGAALDTLSTVLEMTRSHRIQENKIEQDRLRGAGALLAPLAFHLQGPAKAEEIGVGPLRMWPGGLCVARSVGDLDTAAMVTPLPHAKQVLIPPNSGARLVMASDGLWDMLTFRKALSTMRLKSPEDGALALLKAISKGKAVGDDVSMIIVDMVGDATQPFAELSLKSGITLDPVRHRQLRKSKSEGHSTKGLFACFRPRHTVADDLTLHSSFTAPPLIGILADVDCAHAYPDLHDQAQTQRATKQVSHLLPAKRPTEEDYTMHGSRTPQIFEPDASWRGGQTSPADTSIQSVRSTRAASEGDKPQQVLPKTASAPFHLARLSSVSEDPRQHARHDSMECMMDRRVHGSARNALLRTREAEAAAAANAHAERRERSVHFAEDCIH